jgi:hypothetical protein
MPNRNASNDRDKVDHSSHPTDRQTAEDLRAPGGGATKRPQESRQGRSSRPAVRKAAKDLSSK